MTGRNSISFASPVGSNIDLDALGSIESLKCVNQYVKLDRIGRGGNSKVFAAFDRLDHSFYAMKHVNLANISRSRYGFSRLEKEIELLQSLSHPNIISLREVLHVQNRDSIYIVTNLANCGSLSSILRSGCLTPSALQYVFKCIASAVGYLHSHKLVHQDIKPANVLLSSAGGVFLTDFGMSHSFETPAVVFGSPLYNAPESVDPEIDPDDSKGKEDIWSLGITLYEMLFGVCPFRGQDVYEIIASIHETDLVAPDGCDKTAWELIKGMLRPNPRERFGIEEVLESEYVKTAGESMNFGFLRAIEIPPVGFDRPIVEQSAIQCGPDYRFEPLPRRKVVRAHSLPFRSRLRV
jgi:serine/threonine protein kinase